MIKRAITLKILGVFLILTGCILNEWLLAYFLTADRSFDNAILLLVVRAFDIGCVVLGITIIKLKIRFYKDLVIASLALFIATFALTEIGLRIYYATLSHKKPQKTIVSTEFGWVSAENLSISGPVKGYGHRSYASARDGFRVFGDLNTTKKKILVIGDSFTQAYQVSNGEAYYDYLQRHHADIELFVYGASGYGTLQEYMILNKYIDLIHPDLILLQFCKNDIFNNSFNLESIGLRDNIHMVRPYYQNGRIVYLYPSQFGWAIQHSSILKILHMTFDALNQNMFSPMENRLSSEHPFVVESLQTTADILGLIKKRVKDLPVVAFLSDESPLLNDEVLGKLAKHHNIHFINGIPNIVQHAKKRGIVVDASPTDTHWSVNGHEIVGQAISDYLERNRFLNP